MTSLNQPPQAKPAIRSILIALMLAIFLGALDQTIVAVSMPAISAQFKDVSQLAWVISGYMVAMTVAVPIYGKLGDLYGRRRLMLFLPWLRCFAGWHRTWSSWCWRGSFRALAPAG